MFTGIIKEIGEIKNISTVVEISAASTLKDLKEGNSVCINGICSTVIALTNSSFTVKYMPETLKKTTANKWQPGDKVNLEQSLSMSDKLDGHFVTGHIDTTGKIIAINNDEFDIAYPKEIAQFIALKGSISIDGIGLTVSKLDTNNFTVSLIPHTLKNTNLGTKKVNNLVNLEVDLISRYLKRMFDARDDQTSYEYLQDRGFI